jgi:hypothetical protein
MVGQHQQVAGVGMPAMAPEKVQQHEKTDASAPPGAKK